MTIFYTKKGDKGKSLFGKKRIAKDSVLLETLGAFDELNSWLGLCATEASKTKLNKLKPKIVRLQEVLFIAQAEVAMLGIAGKSNQFIKSSHLKELEREIDMLDKKIPDLKKFVIPGASKISARLDVARAVSRRAERILVKLSKSKKINTNTVAFLNRFSSILFALSRWSNVVLKVKEKNPSYK